MELVTNRTERVAPGSALRAHGRLLEIESSRPFHDRWLVFFRGVGSREEAELLRDAPLSAPALEDPEAFWVHELIGSEVRDAAGHALGTVKAVLANPASDLLELDGGGLVPVRFVTRREPGQVVVDLPSGLLD